MPATAIVKTQTTVTTSLGQIFAQLAAKRETDLIRFRTCCADPRASR
ncbi:hypothetical protein SAMN05444920_118236 [Nonomuraea solani]|uniref:Uncharacterized protein n=1 Tax=Nonomuraea solani TaxID=1144553 RepID=A0A1H6ET52_9ACTN|nr:hypothetical protein [Nonomuraea solani]SEH01047.1 hypothetical protein SAMN05444920_118236 [Nonomuraea solani]